MLVVPFAFDQPDNAARVERLGLAKSIPRNRYNARRAVQALRNLLGDSRFQDAASRIGQAVRAEEGAHAAADMIENRALPVRVSCHANELTETDH
jgi:UDP:flavonoid glycosyltransferase YjiC (YdhE family)